MKEKIKFRGKVKAKCHDDYPMQDAYVVFESKIVRDTILAEYQKYEAMSNFLKTALCSYGRRMFPPTKFHKINL